MLTIREIKERLKEVKTSSDPFLSELSTDSRVGVQKAIITRLKRIESEVKEEQRLEAMLTYEKEGYEKGYSVIVGIDEVGRGPLAGPVVAAAVALPKNCKIPYLNDSKKIPKSKHQEIYNAISKEALAIGIGVVEEKIIDQCNIYQATKTAMKEALEDLTHVLPKIDYLLVDAMTLDVSIPQISLIKGDAKSMSIAAASIIAKVTRDKIMCDFNDQYPGYHFDTNAGYGTKEHLQALAKQGISPIHRRSFEPIKSMIFTKK